jgi:flavodoxin
MSELVLFYSYSGNTKKVAEKFSQDNNFDICEVIDKKRPNKFIVFIVGIPKVMKGSGFKINPLTVKFEDYDIINIFSPVWGDHITPSMVSALKLIPKGTKVKLFMVSMSGKSGKDSQSKRIEDLGLEIVGYEDIKS